MIDVGEGLRGGIIACNHSVLNADGVALVILRVLSVCGESSRNLLGHRVGQAARNVLDNDVLPVLKENRAAILDRASAAIHRAARTFSVVNREGKVARNNRITGDFHHELELCILNLGAVAPVDGLGDIQIARNGVRHLAVVAERDGDSTVLAPSRGNGIGCGLRLVLGLGRLEVLRPAVPLGSHGHRKVAALLLDELIEHGAVGGNLHRIGVPSAALIEPLERIVVGFGLIERALRHAAIGVEVRAAVDNRAVLVVKVVEAVVLCRRELRSRGAVVAARILVRHERGFVIADDATETVNVPGRIQRLEHLVLDTHRVEHADGIGVGLREISAHAILVDLCLVVTKRNQRGGNTHGHHVAGLCRVALADSNLDVGQIARRVDVIAGRGTGKGVRYRPVAVVLATDVRELSPRIDYGLKVLDLHEVAECVGELDVARGGCAADLFVLERGLTVVLDSLRQRLEYALKAFGAVCVEVVVMRLVSATEIDGFTVNLRVRVIARNTLEQVVRPRRSDRGVSRLEESDRVNVRVGPVFILQTRRDLKRRISNLHITDGLIPRVARAARGEHDHDLLGVAPAALVDDVLSLLHAQIDCRAVAFRLDAIDSAGKGSLRRIVNDREALEDLRRRRQLASSAIGIRIVFALLCTKLHDGEVVLNGVVEVLVHVRDALDELVRRVLENVELGGFRSYSIVDGLSTEIDDFAVSVPKMPRTIDVYDVLIFSGAVLDYAMILRKEVENSAVYHLVVNLFIRHDISAGVHVARSVKHQDNVERLRHNLGTGNRGSGGKGGEGDEGAVGVIVFDDDGLGGTGDVFERGVAIPYGLVGPHTTGRLGVPAARIRRYAGIVADPACCRRRIHHPLRKSRRFTRQPRNRGPNRPQRVAEEIRDGVVGVAVRGEGAGQHNHHGHDACHHASGKPPPHDVFGVLAANRLLRCHRLRLLGHIAHSSFFRSEDTDVPQFTITAQYR